MKKKRINAAMLAGLMLATQATSVFAAENFDSHWAAQALSRWQAYGIINGDENGNINPDKPITRGELTVILDNMMNYQIKANNNFSDLSNTWYTDAILGANAAGIINGYTDGTVKPNANITRQEAVSMFARILDLDVDTAPAATYNDISSVGNWALPAVNAMTAKGYISGSDNLFRPTDNITRAEVITIINNIFASYISDAGTYSEDVAGNAVISADGVNLKDMTISGDLIIAEGVGAGHIELDNVTVVGRLIVRGGGENSIIIKGKSSVGTVSVSRQGGKVRVSVEDDARVSVVEIEDGSDAVKIEGTIGTVSIEGASTDVEITGTVNTIKVSEAANYTNLTLSESAKVENVKTDASKVIVSVSGTVKNVSVTGSDVTIFTSESAKMESIITSGANTTVSGDGKVSKVEAIEGSTGTTVDTDGTNVENNGSGDVTTGDGSTVKPGQSGNSGTGSTGGSSTGGSSTGGGSTGGTSQGTVTVETFEDFEAALKNSSVKTIIINGQIFIGGTAADTAYEGKEVTIPSGKIVNMVAPAWVNLSDMSILNIESGASFNIGSNTELLTGGNAVINNAGTIKVDSEGMLDCMGTINNTGTIQNNGTLYCPTAPGGTITGEIIYTLANVNSMERLEEAIKNENIRILNVTDSFEITKTIDIKSAQLRLSDNVTVTITEEGSLDGGYVSHGENTKVVKKVSGDITEDKIWKYNYDEIVITGTATMNEDVSLFSHQALTINGELTINEGSELYTSTHDNYGNTVTVGENGKITGQGNLVNCIYLNELSAINFAGPYTEFMIMEDAATIKGIINLDGKNITTDNDVEILNLSDDCIITVRNGGEMLFKKGGTRLLPEGLDETQFSNGILFNGSNSRLYTKDNGSIIIGVSGDLINLELSDQNAYVDAFFEVNSNACLTVPMKISEINDSSYSNISIHNGGILKYRKPDGVTETWIGQDGEIIPGENCSVSITISESGLCTRVYGSAKTGKDFTIGKGETFEIVQSYKESFVLDHELNMQGNLTLETTHTYDTNANPFVISQTGHLNILSDATVKNEAKIINNGTITNAGTIDNSYSGQIYGDGTFNNTGISKLIVSYAPSLKELFDSKYYTEVELQYRASYNGNITDSFEVAKGKKFIVSSSEEISVNNDVGLTIKGELIGCDTIYGTPKFENNGSIYLIGSDTDITLVDNITFDGNTGSSVYMQGTGINLTNVTISGDTTIYIDNSVSVDSFYVSGKSVKYVDRDGIVKQLDSGTYTIVDGSITDVNGSIIRKIEEMYMPWTKLYL